MNISGSGGDKYLFVSAVLFIGLGPSLPSPMSLCLIKQNWNPSIRELLQV